MNQLNKPDIEVGVNYGDAEMKTLHSCFEFLVEVQ